MKNNLFKDKKVLIMGLGLHGGGAGVTKFFCEQGAEVLITDLKTKEQLTESLDKLKKIKKIKYTLGRHEKKDFLWPDLIIKNPDVPKSSPFLEIARKNKIPIETDINLFFKLSKAYIIGVTGTKGKSTTTSLIYHILQAAGKKVFLAGNIGVSALEILPKIKSNKDIVVLELSSFELEDLTHGPDIAVITNILPDHLNRYETMEEYIEAKKNIFKRQTNKDCLVLNADDSIVRQFSQQTKSKICFFSEKEKPKDINLSNFKLLGKHNLYNLLASIKVAEILKINPKIIEKAIETFKGVQNRQELVEEIRGVKFINDTTSTMPHSVVAAVKSFKENFPQSRIILICGGQDKNLEYEEMAQEIKKNVDLLIMLPGTASDKIKKLLELKKINEISSMREAVEMSARLSKSGDLVLLSPGAASFNLFKNEFDRGNQFVKFVRELKKRK